MKRLLLHVFHAAVACTLISSHAWAAWEEQPSLPEEMGNFACATMGENIVLIGGVTWKSDSKLFLDGIWSFNPGVSKWTTIGKMPQPVAYAAYGQLGESLYLAGGSDGKQTLAGLVRVNANLEPARLAEIPLPVVHAGGAVLGQSLYVVAGARDASDTGTLTSAFHAIDLQSGKVERLPEYPGGKVMLPAAAAVEGKIFVFTGASFPPARNVTNVDSAYAYSVAAKSWKPIRPYPSRARGVAACPLGNRHILVGGGYSDEFLDEAFVYDTQNDTYTTTTQLPYPALGALIHAGDYVYWAGGEDRMRHRTNRFYRIARRELLPGR